jgi:hypothetical protein
LKSGKAASAEISAGRFLLNHFVLNGLLETPLMQLP